MYNIYNNFEPIKCSEHKYQSYSLALFLSLFCESSNFVLPRCKFLWQHHWTLLIGFLVCLVPLKRKYTFLIIATKLMYLCPSHYAYCWQLWLVLCCCTCIGSVKTKKSITIPMRLKKRSWSTLPMNQTVILSGIGSLVPGLLSTVVLPAYMLRVRFVAI